MMYARCLSRGARAFASDAVSGMYDQYEVGEFTNSTLTVTEDGDVLIDDGATVTANANWQSVQPDGKPQAQAQA